MTLIDQNGTARRNGRPIGAVCGSHRRWANPVLTPDQARDLKARLGL